MRAGHIVKKETVYGYEWLPGYKEMMVCKEDLARQNEEMEQSMEEGQKDSPEPSGTRQEMQRPQPKLLPPEELQKEEEGYWKDYDYMVRLLPLAAREIWAAVDAILDRYEFCESSMYAEYPDKEAVRKIVDEVYNKMKYYEEKPMETKMDGTEGINYYYIPEEKRGMNSPLRDLIFVIISWNMSYRRQRFCRRKKVFPQANLM